MPLIESLESIQRYTISASINGCGMLKDEALIDTDVNSAMRSESSDCAAFTLQLYLKIVCKSCRRTQTVHRVIQYEASYCPHTDGLPSMNKLILPDIGVKHDVLAIEILARTP
jgi:hypothetical protein